MFHKECRTLSENDNLDSFAELVRTIAALRSPQGCPWDRAQTHASLKPYLIEECYEVIEALDNEDSAKLSEELGDLLMQILLHAQIAAEEGRFDIGDIIRSIDAKLKRRHPHVFGNGEAKDAQEVAAKWETLKREERGEDALLSGLPKGMPSLAYSQAIQRRAASVGFDWIEDEGVIKKVAEEASELQQATDDQSTTEEFGDLLFSLANVARRRGIDLESALRGTNDKFHQRFAYMEKAAQQRKVSLDSMSLEELDALWDEAKQALSPGRGERI